MKITRIVSATRDSNRVNVFIDGKYTLSLDIAQVSDLGISVGREYTTEELDALQVESTYGKVYTQSLAYCMRRPHSSREMRDYLRRKSLPTTYRNRTGELRRHTGVDQVVIDRVYHRLIEKGYVDDEVFARWWVSNRHQAKGMSRRALVSELKSKGLTDETITSAIEASGHQDKDELTRIIAKKRHRYPDPQKLKLYLARQGFSYDDIMSVLAHID